MAAASRTRPESRTGHPRRTALARSLAAVVAAGCASLIDPPATTSCAVELVPIAGAATASAPLADGPRLVPIHAVPAGPQTASGSGMQPLASLPTPSAVSAAAGLPPLRPISLAPLPSIPAGNPTAIADRGAGPPASSRPSVPAIRSLPIEQPSPRHTAGMAALGLAPVQSAQPLRGLPVAPQQPPAPRPPIADTAIASLPIPRPISYAPLPVAPQTSLVPPAPVAPPVAAAPLLPPPLPVAAPPTTSLPPPLPVAPLPVAAAPLPVPAAPAATIPPPPVPTPIAAAMPQHQPLPAEPGSLAAPPAPSVPAAASPPPAGKPTDAVMIASFNIQVFGESKLAKPQVVDVLTKVVRQFDIVAVQEVRAKSDSVVPTFVSKINADGSRYQYVIGPRLGRTVSKEQYTFIYDTNRIELDPSSVGTLPNPGDKFHRPPLRARFRVRTNPPEAGFSFWLVDIHTDPDEVPQEVDALADAFVSMRSFRPDEDDVIVLGDLNAGPPQFGRIRQIPGIGWAVSGVTTNTRRSKTYDNLIFDRTVTGEYTGRWGVLDLQDTFRIPLDKALEVSDHNPVWAAFSPWEARQVAGQATPPR